MKGVVQFRSRNSLRGGLANHVRGHVRSPAALARPKMAPVIVLLDRVEDCDARYKAALRKRGKKPGQKPKPCVELVFGGPIIDTGRWIIDQSTAWAKDCLELVEKRVGADCVALAALHTDERSWHIHILVSCCLDGMPLGSNSVRTALSEGYADNVRLTGIHRRESRGVVDAYQAEVGTVWGFWEPARAVNIQPKRVDVALAKKLRIEDQIVVAHNAIERYVEQQQLQPIDDPYDPIDPSLQICVDAWSAYLERLENALETGDLTAINYSEVPIPNCSAEEWERLKDEAEAQRAPLALGQREHEVEVEQMAAVDDMPIGIDDHTQDDNTIDAAHDRESAPKRNNTRHQR